MEEEASSADILGHWSTVVYGHACSLRQTQAHWEPCQRLVEAARDIWRAKASKLKELLSESHGRLGFEDPLTLRFDLHRWLAPEREEAYSDWLAWLLIELGSEQVWKLLFGQTPPFWNSPLTADRELPIPEGHEDHSGRLDIKLQFGDSALVVIEVKRGETSPWELKKHKGYSNWLKSEGNSHFDCRIGVLVADEKQIQTGDTDGFGFVVLRWDDFCQRARKLISTHLRKHGKLKLMTAVLLAAFIGAAEINLLKLPSLAWACDADSDDPLLLSNVSVLGPRIDAVIAHLENVLC